MLKLDNVSKIYSTGKGIKNISLNIKAGQIISFIGPNGSGKSTLFKLLAGVSTKDSGDLYFFDKEINDIANIPKISYLPDEPFIYGDLSPIEFLNFVQSMKDINSEKNILDLLKDFELWDVRTEQMKLFSFGMRKKVSLIATIMNEPQLLILDEPTNGLDTKAIINIKKHITKLKKNNSIIILSSHIIEILGDISDKIVFLKEGNIVEISNGKDNIHELYKNLYLS